jgi:hypothetical protein
MVKKPRDSVVLYPRHLAVSKVDRGRVKKAIAVLTGASAGQVRSPSATRGGSSSATTLRTIRTKRAVAARVVRRRIVERSVP